MKLWRDTSEKSLPLEKKLKIATDYYKKYKDTEFSGCYLPLGTDISKVKSELKLKTWQYVQPNHFLFIEKEKE